MVFKKTFNKKNNKNQQTGEEVFRVRTPRDDEVLGILEQRLGASRNKVRCFDGMSRVCRIPGKLKRKLWVRENDIVLVKPWEFGGNEKGDIVFKYKSVQVDFLKKKGYLDNLDEMNEF
ncbi:MAG: translation initiation factor eIF-1A [Candidatus Woesearchaeota archaeon]